MAIGLPLSNSGWLVLFHAQFLGLDRARNGLVLRFFGPFCFQPRISVDSHP